MSNALALCLPNVVSSNTMADQATATLPDPDEVPPTRRRRRRPRPIEDLTLTEAQVEEGQQEVERLNQRKKGTDYHRNKKRMLMKIVKYLDQNSGERFLCEGTPTESWTYPKVLDVLKVEAEEEQFFKLFSTYLGSMEHKKLTFKATGRHQKVRHATIKKFCTALNSAWADIWRKVPYKLSALTKDLKSNKRKAEKELISKGDIEDDGGREDMSFALYVLIAMYFLKKGMLFAHFFLLMCWVTMVRNCNCGEIVFINCKWVEDAFAVSVKRTKTNGEGKRDVQKDWKHIYANIWIPEICPILGMAMYFLGNPMIGAQPNSKKFFPGSFNHVTFNDLVVEALKDKEFTDMLDDMGIPYKNVGAYSTRKGSTTYCCSGSVDGPPIISVLLRAGWAIGKTLESYLRFARAGDNFCGRVVCGLPQQSSKFSALPPHFKRLTREEDRNLLRQALSEAFPFYALWGDSFQPVVRMMLASLVKHQDWIIANLSIDHPVRTKPLFMNGLLPQLKPLLATGDAVTMSATGIPTWCVQLLNQDRIEQKVDRVSAKVDALPGILEETIRSTFQEIDAQNGTASVPIIQQLMKDQAESIRAIMRQEMGERRPAPAAAAAATNTVTEDVTERRTTGGCGLWMWAHAAGVKKYREMRYRFTPKDFRLSFDLKSKKRNTAVNLDTTTIHRRLVNAYDAWTWWWEGLQYGGNKIVPLRRLEKDAKFHLYLVNAQKRYSDLAYLVNAMVALIEELGASRSVKDQSKESKRHLFKVGWNLMVNFIKKNHPLENKRNKDPKETLAYTTLKKDYCTAVNWVRAQKQLTEIVTHLMHHADSHIFLKDVEGVEGQKALDRQTISNRADTFCELFVGFLSHRGCNKRTANVYKLSLHTI